MPALEDRGDPSLGWTADLSDRYEVVREHARGGMATVYLARDLKHDRQVALKLLNPELAAGIGAERFLREIQTAAHLNHPHIVPLLDSGVAGGLPYYVMPFVEGESLRERLGRASPLPVGLAVRIAREIAEALQYAHERGVLHRDIKPGNVLLSSNTAVVTDFGIAAALDRAPTEDLTRTGHAIGSLGYMSPEQASGERDLDASTDWYSLASVLFEMLTGRTPFIGKNVRALLTRQLTEDVPYPSSLNPEVPPALDDLVVRFLDRDPASRGAGIADFSASLDRIGRQTGFARVPKPAVHIAGALGLLVTLTAASVLLIPTLSSRSSELTTVRPDTSRYAVFPFDNQAGPDVELVETTLIDAALQKWEDIETVPGFQLDEAAARTGRKTLTVDQASKVALAQGAGRFIMGAVVRRPDSLLGIQAALYDPTGDGPVHLATYTGRLAADADVDSLFVELVTHLLWAGNPPTGTQGDLETRSLEAWKAKTAGDRAVARWDLPLADSAYSIALRWDPDYPDAHLWLALIRSWRRLEPEAWTIPAHQAVLRSDRLPHREAQMAAALDLQAQGMLGAACPKWTTVTREYPDDFAAWYGLAVCLSSDRTVVAAPDSPTGWLFRSSRGEAIRAYSMAFRILPSVLESFRANSYASLRELLHLSGTWVVRGYSVQDSARFLAFGELDADTLAYFPRPDSIALEVVERSEHRRREEAVRRLRSEFRSVAATWAASSPASGSAREALAISLAMEGNSASIDTIRSARQLNLEDSDAESLVATEVWLNVAFGLPGDQSRLRRAKALADSLLHQGVDDPLLGAGLAALTGRGSLGVEYAERWPDTTVPGPRSLSATEKHLLMLAAMGGPADSLDAVSARLIKMVSELDVEQQSAILQWLGLPASIAYPWHPLEEGRHSPDWLVQAHVDQARGDTAAARQALEVHGSVRPESPPYSRAVDAVYSEATLWYALHEPENGIAWLDPTLRDLPALHNLLQQPARIASLVRCAILRSVLAKEVDDPEAARYWADAVVILWQDADPFLQPVLEQMDRLSARPHRPSTGDE